MRFYVLFAFAFAFFCVHLPSFADGGTSSGGGDQGFFQFRCTSELTSDFEIIVVGASRTSRMYDVKILGKEDSANSNKRIELKTLKVFRFEQVVPYKVTFAYSSNPISEFLLYINLTDVERRQGDLYSLPSIFSGEIEGQKYDRLKMFCTPGADKKSI